LDHRFAAFFRLIKKYIFFTCFLVELSGKKDPTAGNKKKRRNKDDGDNSSGDEDVGSTEQGVENMQLTEKVQVRFVLAHFKGH
jgi:hypothetical protein